MKDRTAKRAIKSRSNMVVHFMTFLLNQEKSMM